MQTAKVNATKNEAALSESSKTGSNRIYGGP